MVVQGTGDTIWTALGQKLFEARNSRFDSPEVPPNWQTLEKVMSRMLFIGGGASYFALGPLVYMDSTDGSSQPVSFHATLTRPSGSFWS